MADGGDLCDRAAGFFRALQDSICDALERADGRARFSRDEWRRPGGGGGLSRALADGDLLEKAGVNWSDVQGDLPEALAARVAGEGRAFRATGISLVLHPQSPEVPAFHANLRCLSRGEGASARRWFGGGADLTPCYLYREDARRFHATLKAACDRHRQAADHARFKDWCDRYFFLPHRGETRGVGGLFFDDLAGDDAALGRTFAFVRDLGGALMDAWLPIAERRRALPWGERERRWQLLRRGRYVEFNLLHDRGTEFGLRTAGRVESILMSLPPLARWEYAPAVEPGSREAELLAALAPRDWLAD